MDQQQTQRERQLAFEEERMRSMRAMREARARDDLQTLQKLISDQDRAIRDIFAYPLEYRHEQTIGYVIHLHRKSVEMLNELNENLKKSACIHIWSEGGEDVSLLQEFEKLSTNEKSDLVQEE